MLTGLFRRHGGERVKLAQLLATLDVDTLGRRRHAAERFRGHWSSREHIMNLAAELRTLSINVRVRHAATVGDPAVAAGD
jgi:hypothetical protein